MTYSQVKNPAWANAEQTLINCDVNFDALDEDFVPFTASPDDTTSYGPKIYADCAAGKYGPVAAYVPPPPPAPPTVEQNKLQAERRLSSTDWVNQPDVYDSANTPHLTNRSDFLTYRSQVRVIAVTPVAGNLNWPTEPTAVWSS